MLEILPPARVASPPRRVTSALLERALFAGLVSFATVTGVLLGIGRRAGTPWRTLNAAAHLVIDGRADGVWNFQSDVTPVGCLVVLAVSMLAGFAATLVLRLQSACAQGLRASMAAPNSWRVKAR